MGCDNVLGSDAVEDSCGICKGNNSECVTHKGLYIKQLPKHSECECESGRIGEIEMGILEGKWRRFTESQGSPGFSPPPSNFRFDKGLLIRDVNWKS